ncbi:MAG: hypothetical protein ABJL67_23620 [Sulfitobacter sp.]
MAVVCAIAALKPAFFAFRGIIKLIHNGGKWKGFKHQGVAPKADEMAKSADLAKGGLLK